MRKNLLNVLVAFGMLNTSAVSPPLLYNGEIELQSKEELPPIGCVKNIAVDTLTTVHESWKHNLHDHLFDVQDKDGFYIVQYKPEIWTK